jgi:hypothetical protein
MATIADFESCRLGGSTGFRHVSPAFPDGEPFLYPGFVRFQQSFFPFFIPSPSFFYP